MAQSYFPILLLYPLGGRCDPSFQHICIPFTQGYSVPSVVEIGPVVLEKKLSMSFQYVAFISLWQRAWPFIWSSMLYVKYAGSWLGDSEEGNMFKDMNGHLERQTEGQTDRQ